ncbi:MAG: carbohydrate kinase family protein [Streptosporangiaceae bacterium]
MISFGTVFLELVFGQLKRLPRPGQEVFSDEFAISCGGAVTSATAAAAAGVRAGLCTVLGDDVGSRLVIEHCAAAGVDLAPSLRVGRAAAGISVVLNFDGDRGFVTHVPPAAAGEPDQAGRWQEVLRRERPAWCYLHAGAGIAPVLRTARDLGCKIMLDTSLGDQQDVVTTIECARLADVFVPNADEMLTLTGAPDVHAAVAAGAAWDTDLVVTRGAAGALVAPAGGPVTEVTDGVREVVVRDLTGAGDAFAGALMAALIGGASLTEAAAAGNAAGSGAVTRLGAVGEVTGSSAIAGWPLGPAEAAWLAGRPER